MHNRVSATAWLLTTLAGASSATVSAEIIHVGGPLRQGIARPPLHLNASPATSVYYTPAQIRHAYGIDGLTATGAGQKIAIVDAYGSSSIQKDLNTFCAQFGLPATTVQILKPSGRLANNSGWALETSLDVEWAHAIAPGATIVLSVARTASLSDLLKAVDAAVQNGANVVSMSWGASEFSGESTYDSHFNQTGVSFFASSGDNGEGVEWPAVSPYVVSVGGTSLYLDASGNYSSETAWSGSGGGISAYVGLPDWQKGWQIWGGGRGVPDVSYVADPNTGVLVVSGSRWYVVGGTSAGAPQWAAIAALANQGSQPSSPPGNPAIYALAGSANTIKSTYFNDITSGNNGPDPDDKSATGYDLVTGLGSPVANNMVPAL